MYLNGSFSFIEFAQASSVFSCHCKDEGFANPFERWEQYLTINIQALVVGKAQSVIDATGRIENEPLFPFVIDSSYVGDFKISTLTNTNREVRIDLTGPMYYMWPDRGSKPGTKCSRRHLHSLCQKKIVFDFCN